MSSILHRSRIVAPHSYVRWLVPPAALAVHLCIGQVYATSVYKANLIASFNASDTQIGFVFSLAILILGITSMALGTWIEKVGPRKTMFVSACFWFAGFLVSALAVHTDILPLLYLGYGVLGGIGLGVGYVSPVSTLMKWFPDRPGLATGLAIMGFGGGALIASPLSSQLLTAYGAPADLATGSREAIVGSLSMMFLTLGVLYFVVMLLGVALIRLPSPDWKPAGFDPAGASRQRMVSGADVSARSAIRTPQFWLLWVVLFCNVTAGIGILENAKFMVQDFFRQADGMSLVTAVAAGGFVGVLSLFNMVGRFVWSSSSDVIGRRNIYMVYLGVGLVMYLLLAFAGFTAIGLFILCSVVIVSFYGGGFATLPAYLRDLFGYYQVGAIHGRVLTAWSAAGVAGPLLVNAVLDASGGHGGQAQLTHTAYTPALIAVAVLLAIGFVANLLIRPVAARHHEDPEVVTAHKATDLAASRAADDELGRGGSGSRSTGILAIIAWIVVGIGVLYGVLNTVLSAVKLFG